MNICQIKKFLCIVLVLIMTFVCVHAEYVEPVVQDQISDSITDSGEMTIVNGVPSDATLEQQLNYSITPLDVSIVIDTSGSMAGTSRRGKQILAYAMEASANFVDLLMTINPSSRIGLVSYSSTADTVLPLSGLGNESLVKQKIYSLQADGNTNQTAGFQMAEKMLNTKRQEATGVVILLTDGVWNDGGDPVPAGWSTAGNNLVYTVGLVGGMSTGEKDYVRAALNAGYEKHYFEVDFDKVDDIDYRLSQIFMSIAMNTTYTNDDNGNRLMSYRLLTDSSIDIRISNEIGDYLSTDVLDYVDEAYFGRMTVLGNNMEQRLFMLLPGKYTIHLRGTRTGKGHFSLTASSGYDMQEKVLLERDEYVHPELIYIIDVSEDNAVLTDQSWEPLDHNATDPFDGKPTRGSQTAATGITTTKTSVFAWHEKGKEIGSIGKGKQVRVLCKDSAAGYVLVGYENSDHIASRGWIKASNVTAVGYVPELIYDEPAAYTVRSGAVARRSPYEQSEIVNIKKDTAAELKHAEYDVDGREWAYLLLKANKKPEAVYVPTDELVGWVQVAPDLFRIGYEDVEFGWRLLIGKNGGTNVMWIAPQNDGSGTVISGNSTSKGGNLKVKGGGRDAFAMKISPEGTIEKSIVTGGSDSESFHCILPIGDDYYVAGWTRSNNKSFMDIWDTSSYSGKTSNKAKQSLALVGKLNRELEIDWMKSFGNGKQTFGFDVVVPMKDGSVTASGWMAGDGNFSVSNAGQQDFFIVNLSPDGTNRKLFSYGSSAQDVPDSAIPTSDGGLILVGSRGTSSVASGQMFILDQNLNQLDNIIYGENGSDIFDNVRTMGDGTYLVTGFTGSYGHGEHDFWAMRVDEKGRAIWQKTFGGSGNEELCGTVVLPNGYAVLVGSTNSQDGDVLGYTGTGTNAWAICIDEDGRMLWQYTMSLGNNNQFISAAVDPADGGLVLGGYCMRKNEKNAFGVVVKLHMP